MVGGLLVSPTALNFGDVAKGQTSPAQAMTITNTTAAPVNIAANGGASGVWGPYLSGCPASLAAGASCNYLYTFTPTAIGPQTSPVGMHFQINGVQVPLTFTGNGVLGLSVSATGLNFGDVIVGTTSPAQAMTITNTTATPVNIAANGGASGVWGPYLSGCPASLVAGASCNYFYTFTPTVIGPQTSPAGMVFTINGVQVPLSFTGNGVSAIAPGSLLITPSTLDFGDVPLGTTSAAQSTTLTNISGVAVPITFVSGALPGGEFVGGTITNNCGATLAAGASCVLSTYAFSPTSMGAQTGSVTETVNLFQHPLVVKGNGVSGLNITPSTIDFGPIPVGTTSAAQSTTLTNTSGVAVPITFISGAVPGGEFVGGTITNNCGLTLASGASCVLSTYAFSPTLLGAQTGSVIETVNLLQNPLVVKGIGTNGAPLVAPAITSATPPGGTVGSPYSFTVTATGTAPVAFSDSGTLPPGLNINATTGAITGTPTTANSYNVTLNATNGILPNAAQSFTLVIVAANTPPIAANDSYSVTLGNALNLTVAAPGVLANDSDPDGNPITAVLGAGPTHGTLMLNANGGFTYTPTPGFSGVDSFSYFANDGTLNSTSAAIVSLAVSGVVITPPDPTPPIVALTIPPGCGLSTYPVIVNLSLQEGPAFTADMVNILSNTLGQALSFLEQSVCGTVTLGGFNGGKLAFIPHTFQSDDARANGIYPMGNGQYQVVRNTQSLVIAPALVHVEQITALLPGVDAKQVDNGVMTASVNGLTYVVQASAAVQLGAATGAGQLLKGSDGYFHFIDTLGNNQVLYPAFADPATLRGALLGLDPNATLNIALDGKASIVLNGQHYTLVPDLTLGAIPAEKVGQYWWQESATRYWVINAQILGTAQGFTVTP
jgi:hypothetical protein